MSPRAFLRSYGDYLARVDRALKTAGRPSIFPGKGLSAEALEDEYADEAEPMAATVDHLMSGTPNPWDEIKDTVPPYYRREGPITGVYVGDEDPEELDPATPWGL